MKVLVWSWRCWPYYVYCDLYLQIFESESVKPFSESEPQLSKITSISFNSSGHQIAIGLDDGIVKVKSLFVSDIVLWNL